MEESQHDKKEEKTFLVDHDSSQIIGLIADLGTLENEKDKLEQ